MLLKMLYATGPGQQAENATNMSSAPCDGALVDRIRSIKCASITCTAQIGPSIKRQVACLAVEVQCFGTCNPGKMSSLVGNLKDRSPAPKAHGVEKHDRLRRRRARLACLTKKKMLSGAAFNDH